MEDELLSDGEWVDISLPELQDTRFIDWHKYAEYVIKSVISVLDDYGIDITENTSYVISRGTSPLDDVTTAELVTIREYINKLESLPPMDSLEEVFHYIIKSGIPLSDKAYVFISEGYQPIFNFHTQNEQCFIVKPYQNNHKGYKVMNGILDSMIKIINSAKLSIVIDEAGDNYYQLHVLEDNRISCTFLIDYDEPVGGKEETGEGRIYVRLSKVPEDYNSRAVRLVNELIRMFHGYIYEEDVNNYGEY